MGEIENEIDDDLNRIMMHLILREESSGACVCDEKLGIYTRAILDMGRRVFTLLSFKSHSEPFIYADTDSVKTEGPYRGGFTHTDSVKEDPNGT